MKVSNRTFAIAIGAGVIAFGVVLAGLNGNWFKRGWFKRDQVAAKKDDAGTEKEPLPEGWVEIGGVRRPASDVERKRKLDRGEPAKGHNWGRSTPVSVDLNASTRSIKESIGKPELAYRRGMMHPAPSFDRAEYERDPQKYLDEVAPGRINQSLAPSKDVAAIRRRGKYIYTLVQGESVSLEVIVKPKMPVTFHSPSLGEFESGLTSITVKADENGVARARFTASGGTRGEIDLRAASPVHSDVARWLIEVVKPQKPDPSKSNQP